MERLNLLIVLFISCILVQSCSTSPTTTKDELDPTSPQYLKRTTEQVNKSIQDRFADFKIAYAKYDSAQYQQAIEFFNTVCESDSSGSYYEAYAFIANSYSKLGQADSGVLIYDKAIRKILKLHLLHPNFLSYNWKYDSLVVWKAQYPKLPEFLTKENGFVPFDEMGALLYNPPPVYPTTARRNGIEGTVWVTVIIDESGSVKQLSVLIPVDDSLDNAAMNAAKNWKFKPCKVKGRIAKVEASIPFKFKLNN